jgi:hypothetical protein
MTTLYEQDYALWSEKMADLIANKRFDELDIENLVEEVGDLSKRERDRLLSSIRLIVHHLLKWDYQVPLRSRSWLGTIQRERLNIIDYLADSPSLRKYVTDEYLGVIYKKARLDAIAETGLEMPDTCPYALNDVINRSLTIP